MEEKGRLRELAAERWFKYREVLIDLGAIAIEHSMLGEKKQGLFRTVKDYFTDAKNSETEPEDKPTV